METQVIEYMTFQNSLQNADESTRLLLQGMAAPVLPEDYLFYVKGKTFNHLYVAGGYLDQPVHLSNLVTTFQTAEQKAQRMIQQFNRIAESTKVKNGNE